MDTSFLGALKFFARVFGSMFAIACLSVAAGVAVERALGEDDGFVMMAIASTLCLGTMTFLCANDLFFRPPGVAPRPGGSTWVIGTVIWGLFMILLVKVKLDVAEERRFWTERELEWREQGIRSWDEP